MEHEKISDPHRKEHQHRQRQQDGKQRGIRDHRRDERRDIKPSRQRGRYPEAEERRDQRDVQTRDQSSQAEQSAQRTESLIHAPPYRDLLPCDQLPAEYDLGVQVKRDIDEQGYDPDQHDQIPLPGFEKEPEVPGSHRDTAGTREQFLSDQSKQKNPKPYDGFGQDLICEDVRQGLPVRSQFLKHGFAV